MDDPGDGAGDEFFGGEFFILAGYRSGGSNEVIAFR